MWKHRTVAETTFIKLSYLLAILYKYGTLPSSLVSLVIVKQDHKSQGHQTSRKSPINSNFYPIKSLYKRQATTVAARE